MQLAVILHQLLIRICHSGILRRKKSPDHLVIRALLFG
jgi:hypothetical protein